MRDIGRSVGCVLHILATIAIAAVVPATNSLQRASTLASNLTTNAQTLRRGYPPGQPVIKLPLNSQYYLQIDGYKNEYAPVNFLYGLVAAQTTMWAEAGASPQQSFTSEVHGHDASQQGMVVYTHYAIQVFVSAYSPLVTYGDVSMVWGALAEFMRQQAMSEMEWSLYTVDRYERVCRGWIEYWGY